MSQQITSAWANLSITSARSKPIREHKAGTRECGYCGRWQVSKDNAPEYYCPTCKPLARALGWIAPLPTYTCERCGKKVAGNVDRTMCGTCTWNHTQGRKAKRESEPKPLPPAAPCGTKAAHARHKRQGEQPCAPCLAAKATYDRDWRAGRIDPRKKGI